MEAQTLLTLMMLISNVYWLPSKSSQLYAVLPIRDHTAYLHGLVTPTSCHFQSELDRQVRRVTVQSSHLNRASPDSRTTSLSLFTPFPFQLPTSTKRVEKSLLTLSFCEQPYYRSYPIIT